jgi:hypothetical protein
LRVPVWESLSLRSFVRLRCELSPPDAQHDLFVEVALQPARFNASRPKMCSDGTHLAVSRELVAMSDWELERGRLASSLGFDQDRRNVANRILRERYAGQEAGVALWIMVIAAGGVRDRTA